MLYWDELCQISWDELRHEYMKLANEFEIEQKANEQLTEDYAELHELLIQRDNEINALKHMLDRKDEEK